jgi:hypothetical protein
MMPAINEFSKAVVQREGFPWPYRERDGFPTSLRPPRRGYDGAGRLGGNPPAATGAAAVIPGGIMIDGRIHVDFAEFVANRGL